MRKQLAERGFKHLTVWTRGVSEKLKSDKPFPKPQNKPKVLNVGRVSKKILDALCKHQDIYDISIVGDGPYMETLKNKYKKVSFLGYKFVKDLADIYTEHDIFAFPSRTDTFGIVMIEAMCNGFPVAGYQVPGPIDLIEPGVTGHMSDELQNAINQCKDLNRHTIKEKARKQWSWVNCFDIFMYSIS